MRSALLHGTVVRLSSCILARAQKGQPHRAGSDWNTHPATRIIHMVAFLSFVPLNPAALNRPFMRFDLSIWVSTASLVLLCRHFFGGGGAIRLFIISPSMPCSP